MHPDKSRHKFWVHQQASYFTHRRCHLRCHLRGQKKASGWATRWVKDGFSVYDVRGFVDDCNGFMFNWCFCIFWEVGHALCLYILNISEYCPSGVIFPRVDEVHVTCASCISRSVFACGGRIGQYTVWRWVPWSYPIWTWDISAGICLTCRLLIQDLFGGWVCSM